MVAHIYNPGTWELEAGGWRPASTAEWDWEQCELNKTVSRGKKRKKKEENKNSDSPPSLSFLIFCSGLCFWGTTGEERANHSSFIPALGLQTPWWVLQAGSFLNAHLLTTWKHETMRSPWLYPYLSCVSKSSPHVFRVSSAPQPCKH